MTIFYGFLIALKLYDRSGAVCDLEEGKDYGSYQEIFVCSTPHLVNDFFVCASLMAGAGITVVLYIGATGVKHLHTILVEFIFIPHSVWGVAFIPTQAQLVSISFFIEKCYEMSDLAIQQPGPCRSLRDNWVSAGLILG